MNPVGYKFRIIVLSALLLILIFPKHVSSHPHVFIDAQIKVHFDSKGVSGFNITWVFDAMFSEIMIDEFDEDFDEDFSKEEQKVIYVKAFSNLKKFNYFTEIYIDNKPFLIKQITNFSARVNEGVLTYSFFIPCHISIGNIKQKLDIYTFDESYYMDVSLTKESISFSKSSGYNIEYQVGEDETKRYYFDQIFPFVLHLYVSKK